MIIPSTSNSNEQSQRSGETFSFFSWVSKGNARELDNGPGCRWFGKGFYWDYGASTATSTYFRNLYPDLMPDSVTAQLSVARARLDLSFTAFSWGRRALLRRSRDFTAGLGFDSEPERAAYENPHSHPDAYTPDGALNPRDPEHYYCPDPWQVPDGNPEPKFLLNAPNRAPDALNDMPDQRAAKVTLETGPDGLPRYFKPFSTGPLIVGIGGYWVASPDGSLSGNSAFRAGRLIASPAPAGQPGDTEDPAPVKFIPATNFHGRQGLNNRGEILGYIESHDLGTGASALWRNGRGHLLDTLAEATHYTALRGRAINDHGFIAATAIKRATGARVPVLMVPVELRQHPITATSGTGEPPAASGPIRFCRWIDAYPEGIRDNQFADKDRDRFQIRIPFIVPNLTKMRIKATELHGAIINGDVQDKTTDGDYEVDMKQENGAMVSEPILLVSVGDDDVTFNGKGTDNGKNDQTLLADFGSKIIVTFPELGTAETIFQAQQPVANVTLDMIYCHPLVAGAAPITAIADDMMKVMKRQTRKMEEIYRQIGFRVHGITPPYRIMTFPAEWLVAHGTDVNDDHIDNLSHTEVLDIEKLILADSATNNVPPTSVRVGFVDALLRGANNKPANGLCERGWDPALVSLRPAAREEDYILSHEVGHALGRPHDVTYAPENIHWLMFEDSLPHWKFQSTDPIRWHKDDAEAMKNKTGPPYVKTP